jgi:hypothetical protein
MEERLAQIRKVINLESVDRLPVIQNASAFGPRYTGHTIAEFCTVHEASMKITLEAMDKLGGLDGINLAMIGRNTPVLSTLWLSRIGVPGKDLPEDSLWQVFEAEVMTIDDYDTILEKSWPVFLNDFLPRVIDPAELGEALGWVQANLQDGIKTYHSHGYVTLAASAMAAPFDYICGGRSMAKFFLDLHRIPDKVAEVMDVMMPPIIEQAIGISKAAGVPGIWIGGWRTASGLLSPKLWQRFVWPYIIQLVNAAVEADLIPILHFDQDWTRDLGYFLDLPAKTCVMNPDGMTSPVKFKEILGDHLAWMGDTPATLFAAGTPEDIDRYVREQVDLFEGRGLIIAPGCDAPINTKPENMEAWVEAAQKYGDF